MRARDYTNPALGRPNSDVEERRFFAFEMWRGLEKLELIGAAWVMSRKLMAAR
jgi:hypothetical protein